MVLRATLVVQVTMNRARRHGALVEFSGPAGSASILQAASPIPADNSARTSLSRMAARYQLTARTLAKTQKPIDLKIEELHWDIGNSSDSARQQILRALPRSESSASASPLRTSRSQAAPIRRRRHAQQDDRRRTQSIISHGGPASTNRTDCPPTAIPSAERDRCR